MKLRFALLACGFALAACGEGAAPAADGGESGAAPAVQTAGRGCALLGDANAFFGQAVTGAPNANGPVADGCYWSTADGLYSAEVMIFTDASLAGANTVQRHYELMLGTMDQMTNEPLVPVAGLGVAAQRADMNRRSSQLSFYKDGVGALVTVGTPTPDVESPPALAERIARAIEAEL